MFVELTLADGVTKETINTEHIRSMRDANVAEGDAQVNMVTTIRFVNGGSEKYQGSRKDIKGQGVR